MIRESGLVPAWVAARSNPILRNGGVSKSGSGGGTRTPDTRIMISNEPLFLLGFFCKLEGS